MELRVRITARELADHIEAVLNGYVLTDKRRKRIGRHLNSLMPWIETERVELWGGRLILSLIRLENWNQILDKEEDVYLAALVQKMQTAINVLRSSPGTRHFYLEGRQPILLYAKMSSVVKKYP
jgi:hypothetical protein